MGTYARTVRSLAERHGITPRDRTKLLAHWPLFKLFWLSVYGTGRAKRAAARAFRPFRRYQTRFDVEAAAGGRLRVPVSFDPFDLQSFREIFFGREYEPGFDLSRARTMVDLGANTGMAALWFLARAPLERVVLVEANPALSDTLRRGLRAAFAAGTAVLDERCVVGRPDTGEVRFFVSDNHRHGSATTVDAPSEAGHEITVPATTLAGLLADHGLDAPDILKMDIEGAEHEILAADPASIARFRHLFAEIHGPRAQRDGFATGIEGLGFTVVRRSPAPDDGCETLIATR